MGKVVWKQAEYERHLERQIVGGLIDVGLEAKAFVKRETPFKSGYARRSIYFAVLNERGQRVAGDTHDANGMAVPRSFPGTGRYRVIVGANAPYYIWIEIGTRGRPGRAALARAIELIGNRVRQQLAEEKRRGRP
jgi:hypothetical protein